MQDCCAYWGFLDSVSLLLGRFACGTLNIFLINYFIINFLISDTSLIQILIKLENLK